MPSAWKNLKWGILLLAGSMTLLVLFLEIIGRLMIAPSPNAHGVLLGRELPPFDLVSTMKPSAESNRSSWYEKLIVDNQKVTRGDLWGFFRWDSVLGYAPQENKRSLNGWWQSNNIGARARNDLAEPEPKGLTRMLVFGDSFAHGSRVRNEETWVSVLDARLPAIEVVNFGVDGYSMAQCYLRYQLLKDAISHDIVLQMFVPTSNLWRDVNTRRDLVAGWDLHWIMPRFILNRGKLRLVQNPMMHKMDGAQQSPAGLEEKMRSHLRSYDRFYFEGSFEVPLIVGKSILFKLIASCYYGYREAALRNSLLDPDSEAMQISRAIFRTLNAEVSAVRKTFVLVILPSPADLKRFQDDPSFAVRWDKTIASLNTPGLISVDLTEDLRMLEYSQLDKGYDGTHYGPHANESIARLIDSHLTGRGILWRP